MSKKIQKHLFSKIEVWMLYLVIIVMTVSGLIFGALVDYNKRGGEKFFELTSKATKISSAIVDGLRYLQNPMRDKELLQAEEKSRFLKHKPGFNVYKNNNAELLMLLNFTDPFSKKHKVKLVDLKNYKTLFEYPFDYEMFRSVESFNNKGFASSITDNNIFFRSSYLTEKNEIITLFSSNSLVKFDPEKGKLHWFKDDAMFHHTFFVNEAGGYIWAIGCLREKNLDKIWRTKRGYCNDSAIKIDLETGETLKSISIGQLMIKSNLHNHLFVGRVNKSTPDPAHINDIEEINIDTEFSQKGNLMLSLGGINMILLIDPINEEILWKFSDGLFFQHDVDILNSQEIAIFNNNRIITDYDKVFKNNEINIYNFKNKKISSPYNNILAKYEVKTRTQGLQEITEYGVLVEEQNFGRYLFFDKDNGELIFEYINKNNENEIFQVHWSRLITNKEKIKKLRDYFND